MIVQLCISGSAVDLLRLYEPQHTDLDLDQHARGSAPVLPGLIPASVVYAQHNCTDHQLHAQLDWLLHNCGDPHTVMLHVNVFYDEVDMQLLWHTTDWVYTGFKMISS
jgi:hypothetical protein